MRPFAEQRIRQEHLERKAIVYVRQSSPGQVKANVESTRVQLGLRENALSMGWRNPVVIDDDLGVSAAGFADRPGFRGMLAQVALRQVGIILCVDASRLSRKSRDWANLFELCGHFDTLIADIDQVYDLSHPNDRLVLGIKGIRPTPAPSTTTRDKTTHVSRRDMAQPLRRIEQQKQDRSVFSSPAGNRVRAAQSSHNVSGLAGPAPIASEFGIRETVPPERSGLKA